LKTRILTWKLIAIEKHRIRITAEFTVRFLFEKAVCIKTTVDNPQGINASIEIMVLGRNIPDAFPSE
jgi:hypothetical protein